MEKMVCDREQEHAKSVQRAREEVLADSDVKELCDMFAMLAEPTRMKILLGLLQGEMCVYHLCEVAGGTPSSVSHQLRKLKDRGIVQSKRFGKNVEYALADEHVAQIIRMGVAHLACQGE